MLGASSSRNSLNRTALDRKKTATYTEFSSYIDYSIDWLGEKADFADAGAGREVA
jgi:hypothetical protein